MGFCLFFLCFFFSCRNSDDDGFGAPFGEVKALDLVVDKFCEADTISGFYRDFDFLTLSGNCWIDSNPRVFPYVEVRYRHDSITVNRWFSQIHHRKFEIRRMGKNGMWVEVMQEPFIKDDSWLKIYVTNPKQLTLLKYRGNTNRPHDWILYRAEAIYPGPVIYSGLPTDKLGKRLKVVDLFDKRNFFELVRMSFTYNDSIVTKEFKILKGLFGEEKVSKYYIHKLYAGTYRNLPHSILWIYFDLDRISR